MGVWHLIETLTADVATVVATDGKIKDWGSTKRLLPANASDLRVDPIVAAVRGDRQPRDLTLTSKRSGEDVRIVAVPIIGPYDVVYGMHLWIGTPQEEAGQPRPASGVAWMMSDFMIHQTLESSEMSGVNPKEFDPIATPAEYVRRSVQFDDEWQFVELALEPSPGKSMNSHNSVRHDTGRVMQWQISVRTQPEGDQAGWRVLMHDVSDVYAASTPSLAQVGMTDGLRGIGYHVALFHVPTGRLAMWISPAADWMEWQFDHLTGPVLNPSDLEAFQDAAARLKSGSSEEFVTVGLLTRDLTYEKSSLRVSPFQREGHEVDEALVLVQVSARQGQDPFAGG